MMVLRGRVWYWYIQHLGMLSKVSHVLNSTTLYNCWFPDGREVRKPFEDVNTKNLQKESTLLCFLMKHQNHIIKFNIFYLRRIAAIENEI